MIPQVLASDPWRAARKREILDLVPVHQSRIEWEPGEREAVLVPRIPGADEATRQRLREDERAMFLRGGIIPIHAGWWLELEDLSLLAERRIGGAFVSHHDLLRPQLARHDVAAIPALLSLLDAWPREVMWMLVRIDSTDIAHAFWNERATSPTLFAAYASSRPEAAALVLLPIALGPDGDARKAALSEVKRMRKAGREAALRSAAARYGEPAKIEIEALFAPPPLPAKSPRLPAFISIAGLPVLMLGDGSMLPEQGLQRLVALATLLPTESARAAIDDALPALDRAGLAELAEALLAAWLAAEAPSKEKWVIYAAALFGDDRVVRALVGQITEWANAGLSARVKIALEAIVAIGSDVALMHVSFLAKKKGALKKAATTALERYREENDISEDALADRTAPDLGLSPTGDMIFDYGARSFRAGFDEQLEPFVLDAYGAKMTGLPRANKQDDATKVSAAQALWHSLKGETKTLAAEQVRRLERAMVSGRRWNHAEFERCFSKHPLMQHLARRLVWGAFTAAGTPVRSFRIAEDGSFANSEDDGCVLRGEETFAVLHPLLLPEEARRAWTTVFADYEIIQPFPQLGRELFAITEDERHASASKRAAGRVAAGSRFFSLKHRGWTFADYDMGKSVGTAAFPIYATLRTEPGLHFLAEKPEDQTLGELTLARTTSDGVDSSAPVFGDLDPIAASELFRDVDALLG